MFTRKIARVRITSLMRPKKLPVILFVSLAALLTITIFATKANAANVYSFESTAYRLTLVLVVCACYSGLYYVTIKWAGLPLSSFLVWLHFAITAVCLVGLTHFRLLSKLIDLLADPSTDTGIPRVMITSMFLFYALVGSSPLYSLILLEAVIKERKTTDLS